ncbi:competence protein CoiA family protein [Vreelandella rituensis]|uniref:Competence protein CoiA-like family protein n=1 Tax=Vreelandella rituensis TaxID=2282306 RepID=A0A368UA82_9GAMM|nr:competence protein CoiA family protein [Halomonas rituensis]RCV93901.1 hypothetical protein DU506_01710 [Halomonas rituensis]
MKDSVSHKIPYGLRDGRAIHISEVPVGKNGLRCECVCPACGHQLLAKMGPKVSHYFAHYIDSNCVTAAETGIHLRAKELLQDRKRFRLPEKEVTVRRHHEDSHVSTASFLVKDGTPACFDRVDLEQPEDGFQPDVTGYIGTRKLFIEIRVTHAVDSEKRDRIKAAGASCVEVDLSKLDRFATPSEIETHLDNTLNSTWIFHAREISLLNQLHVDLEADYQTMVAENHKIAENEKRSAQRKADFKTALGHLGRKLSERIARHAIIPSYPAYSDSRPLSLVSHNESLNAATLECGETNHKAGEIVLVAWVYKQARHYLHRNARSLDIPYCTVDIAPLLALHNPPHNPICEADIDCFLLESVVDSLRNSQQWHVRPGWLKAKEAEETAIARRQEESRINAERAASVARHRERYHQAARERTRQLNEGVARLGLLASECQSRAEAIERARGRTDIAIRARWALVSEGGAVTTQVFNHINIESFDGSMSPLGFPYPHEWAYSEHPDFIKALVVDRVLAKRGYRSRQKTLSMLDIDSIFSEVVTALTRDKTIFHLLGASRVANLVFAKIGELRSIGEGGVVTPMADAPFPELDEANRLMLEAIKPFHDSDLRTISPNAKETRSKFLSLLCDDMVHVGILYPAPVDERRDHIPRFWLQAR